MRKKLDIGMCEWSEGKSVKCIYVYIIRESDQLKVITQIIFFVNEGGNDSSISKFTACKRTQSC